jgi:hypothetical protein
MHLHSHCSDSVKGNVDTIVLPSAVEGGDLWQRSFGICAGKWFRLETQNEGHSTHIRPVAHAVGYTWFLRGDPCDAVLSREYRNDGPMGEGRLPG